MDGAGDLTAAAKRLALEAGFARAAALSLAEAPPETGLADWVAAGYAGDMTYLQRHAPMRLAPQKLVEGAKSVICLAASYAPVEPGPGIIARYARGRDYHKVLKKRCRRLAELLRRIEPTFVGRAFVDIGPVGERHLAAAAGLGWIGRNGCLYVPGLGSYVLLAEVFCNLPLRTERPVASGCGDCQACMKACPTGAFVGPGRIDARKCVSYLTIEHKGQIDPALARQMGNRLFGCDACQEACPHNRTLLLGDEELTAEYWRGRGLAGPLGGAGPAEILTWTADDWSRATQGSAVRRASLEQLKRNAEIVVGKGGG